MTIEENASLLKHNTFGIEAKSALFIEYASLQELKDAISRLADNHPELPLLHIGKGSNLLFVNDFKGCILHSAAKKVDVISEQGDEVIVRAEGGITWDDFVAYCTKAGYYGLENLSLIPGEVGAAAVQNIGAYGSEVKDFIVRVNLVNLKTAEETSLTNDQCHYAYRQSIFKNELKGRFAVYSVDFRLSKSFRPNLDYGSIRHELEKSGIADNVDAQTLRQTIIDIRQGKLPEPEVLGNAGSFFMNPVVPQEKFEELLSQYPEMPHYPAPNGVKIPAGWMIQQCGWKGKRLGPAGVYEKQALVLVNHGGAKGEDIVRLCQTIQKDVKERFGTDINPEVNFIE